ncbi:MAG TPA: hypothetical protein VIL35_15995 [Vicinamibacterales bacterium]
MAHTDPHHGPQGTGAAPTVNHETTDIPLTGTTRAALLSLVIVFAVMGLMYLAWGFFVSRVQATDPGRPPMAAEDFGQRLPPTPRLQSEPGPDLARYRAEQEQRLSTWGWVDQAAGTVHIPIDRAMDLVVERADQFADPSLAAPADGVAPADAPAPSPGTGETPAPAETAAGGGAAEAH